VEKRSGFKETKNISHRIGKDLVEKLKRLKTRIHTGESFA
jgi:hypothetical protein